MIKQPVCIISFLLTVYLVNTLAAEVLYLTIRQYCAVTADTILVDICCGTGTIGISMARVVQFLWFFIG